ncbi:MAG TPA: protein kinase [Terriglobales bacterium]|nr:protein kinase [Terriglobales bacterium]
MSGPAPELAKVLDRYHSFEQIGAGGIGEVYLAHDDHLDRQVAVKVLRVGTLADEAARKRFHNEAMLLSKLNHPNIAAIYDFDSHDGRDFLIMEYVPGETLSDALQRGPFEPDETLQLGVQLAEGLAVAHAAGVIHRDLKPGNLRITPTGRLKTLDFGLARSSPRIGDASTADATSPFQSLTGTLPYMAPEQLRGESTDGRTDIYSAGTVLYEMVTGRRPFDHPLPTVLVDSILHGVPVPPHEYRPGLSSFLEYLILKCIEKNPEHRYQSAFELITDFKRAIANEAKPQASLAVLYFENLGGHDEDEYFRNGITEDITTELSRISGLHVVSRSAVLGFRAHPVAASKVGQQLGATHIVEGSIRRDRGKLRITAKLVETRTGHTLWAERFDRQLEDVFAIQDEIAHSIARTLRVMLTETEKRAIDKVPTSDFEAYDFYLRGRQYFHQFRRKGYDLARQMFNRAIEIDPAFARAYAGIADCSSFLYMYWDSVVHNLEKADEASLMALQLDPDLPEAHASRGLAAYLRKQYQDAQKEFERAIRLQPRLFEPYYFSARTYYAQGKLEQAVRWFDKASEVRPEDYQSPMLLASALNGLSRKAEALAAYRRGLAACEKHLEFHPGDSRALYFGANALSQLEDRTRCLVWLQQALDIEPEEPQVLYNVACVYALLGESDKAIDCLEKSITRGWEQHEWMEHDPDLASLRDHPRFQALIGHDDLDSKAAGQTA